VAKNESRPLCQRDPSIFTRTARSSKNWFFAYGGSLDPETGEPVIGGEIRTATQRLINIVDASASGAFVPNREKDELMYALQTPEHPGQT
jgi:hypothetical protein